MFCGSSYKPSLFQQQHIRKSLYLPTVGIVTAAPTMADEPSAPVAQATHAHECNGDREGSPCTDLSESGASIIDGATENMKTHIISELHITEVEDSFQHYRNAAQQYVPHD